MLSQFRLLRKIFKGKIPKSKEKRRMRMALLVFILVVKSSVFENETMYGDEFFAVFWVLLMYRSPNSYFVNLSVSSVGKTAVARRLIITLSADKLSLLH